MKENESYSIHQQSSSDAHKIREPKSAGSSQTQPDNQPYQVPAAQVNPVIQPQPLNEQTYAQPTPVAAHEIGKTREVRQPAPNGQEEAVAMARAKIAAIFGQEEQRPEPGQAPQIAQGYNQEQVLQTEIDPSNSHVQPDHALPQPSQQNYPTQTTPAVLDATARPAPQEKVTKPKKRKVAKPDLAKAKATAKIGKEKINSIKSKIADKKQAVKNQAKTKDKDYEKANKSKWKRYAPLAVIVLIVVLIFNNQLVYGQISYYVTPGNREDLPKITEPTTDTSAPAGNRIVIPKINVNVPINYKVDSYEEEAIQAGLEDGVVHYANTGMPGQVGNNVLLGHNTNNFWNSGKYKTAFVLLDRLDEGDTFEVHYKQTRYIYQIYEKKIIEPDDFSVVTQKVTEPIVTLITCHPPGTSWQRLIVQARQISPEPEKSAEPKGTDLPEELEGEVPSAAPSVWESLTGWLL